jgi:hypothetical protein
MVLDMQEFYCLFYSLLWPQASTYTIADKFWKQQIGLNSGSTTDVPHVDEGATRRQVHLSLSISTFPLR